MWNLAQQAEGQSVLSTVMKQEADKGIHMPPQLMFQHFGHRHTVRTSSPGWYPVKPQAYIGASRGQAGSPY